jgi:hypothetical protein
MPSYGPPQASPKAPSSKQPSTRVLKVARDCIGCETYSIVIEILHTIANRAIGAFASCRVVAYGSPCWSVPGGILAMDRNGWLPAEWWWVSLR